ncbi:MAG: hypothetical protein LBN96_08740 [Desulfovibrio sp.]|nr:hypothetical protein [Desulfovibrio sp.]
MFSSSSFPALPSLGTVQTGSGHLLYGKTGGLYAVAPALDLDSLTLAASDGNAWLTDGTRATVKKLDTQGMPIHVGEADDTKGGGLSVEELPPGGGMPLADPALTWP